MFVCVENPRTSRYVMDLMQDQALDQKFSKQPKQDSLRFADASTAQMKLENVMELTAHYKYTIKHCVPHRMRCLFVLSLAVSLVGIFSEDPPSHMATLSIESFSACFTKARSRS